MVLYQKFTLKLVGNTHTHTQTFPYMSLFLLTLLSVTVPSADFCEGSRMVTDPAWLRAALLKGLIVKSFRVIPTRMTCDLNDTPGLLWQVDSCLEVRVQYLRFHTVQFWQTHRFMIGMFANWKPSIFFESPQARVAYLEEAISSQRSEAAAGVLRCSQCSLLKSFSHFPTELHRGHASWLSVCRERLTPYQLKVVFRF